jgi:CRISPR system Cascade subunit CasA
MSEFNLLDEAWIRVTQKDGVAQKVSLKDAIMHADEYIGLANDSPLLDFALLRLMEAVLFSAFWDKIDDLDAEDIPGWWKVIWDSGKYPGGPLERYFEKWHDRFYLFDDAHPFYQIPVKSDAWEEHPVGTVYPIVKMDMTVVESNNKPVLRDYDRENMTYDKTAVNLVGYMAFHDAFKLSLAMGGKKGNDDKAAVGRCGSLGGIYLKGKSLFQTLMLNWTLLRRNEEPWPSRESRGIPEWWQRAPWELDHPRTEQTPIDAKRADLKNPMSILTCQTIRIMLHRTENRTVDKIQLYGGDVCDVKHAYDEPMTLWQTVTDSKTKKPDTVPKRHSGQTAEWREIPAVFPADKSWTPLVLYWAGILVKKGYISGKSLLRSVLVGISEYGSQNYGVKSTVNQSLGFHTSLLTETKDEWRLLIKEETKKAEDAGSALWSYAQSILKANGQSIPDDKKSQNKIGDPCENNFYRRLNAPFISWLSSIDPNKDTVEEKRKEFERTAIRIALSTAEDTASVLPSSAYIGSYLVRDQKTGNKERFSIAEENSKLNYKLYQLIYKSAKGEIVNGSSKNDQ